MTTDQLKQIESEAASYAGKVSFRVPYDGSNKFYDDNHFKWAKESFIAGAQYRETMEEDAVAALKELVKLKDYKDANGKDEVYEKKQPLVWAEARRIISNEQATPDSEVKRMREALLIAVGVIKQWHQADDVWDIYYNHAPEMKPIREALNPQQ